MNTSHKILAVINMVIFLGGFRMVSKLGAVLGLLYNPLTIAFLVLVILTPIIWGAILSWRYYRRKTNPTVLKKSWPTKILAVFPFLNLITLLLFILVIIFYQ